MAKQIFFRQFSSDYQEQGNINLVWRELENRFGFPPKKWKIRFNEYCDVNNYDRINGFYYFGYEVINPILNDVLCRRSGYPTFQNLIEYGHQEK